MGYTASSNLHVVSAGGLGCSSVLCSISTPDQNNKGCTVGASTITDIVISKAV